MPFLLLNHSASKQFRQSIYGTDAEDPPAVPFDSHYIRFNIHPIALHLVLDYVGKEKSTKCHHGPVDIR